MADHWASPTGSYSFRFFSPEQIDRTLREGVKRGRAGSHDAIERISNTSRASNERNCGDKFAGSSSLRMENFIGARSGVQKTTKSFGRVMGKGGMGSEQQCANFLGGIPCGGPHSIWGRAARLGLVEKDPKKVRQRSRQPWTEDDDRILLIMAGYKTAEFIAKAYVGPKTPSAIASLSWERAVAFI